MDYCSNYTSNLQIAIVIMVAAATLAYQVSSISPAAVGAAVVAVAVVAQAVWGMARNLCPDAPRISIMAAATCFVLLVPSAWGQVSVIILAAIIGAGACTLGFTSDAALPVLMVIILEEYIFKEMMTLEIQYSMQILKDL